MDKNSNPVNQTRRQFLKTIVRGGILASVAVFSGVMTKRWLDSPGCRNDFACGRCMDEEKCALPEARVYRTRRKEMMESEAKDGRKG